MLSNMEIRIAVKTRDTYSALTKEDYNIYAQSRVKPLEKDLFTNAPLVAATMARNKTEFTVAFVGNYEAIDHNGDREAWLYNNAIIGYICDNKYHIGYETTNEYVGNNNNLKPVIHGQRSASFELTDDHAATEYVKSIIDAWIDNIINQNRKEKSL